MKLFTFDPKKNKQITAGKYDELTKTFSKKVGARHYMRVVKGYGIQEDVIKKLCELKCEFVVFYAPGCVLKSEFKEWIAPDKRVLDFGSGPQRFFTAEKMRKYDKEYYEE